MNEIFKDIPSFEGLYQVSNFGRVKSLDRKVRVNNGFRTVRERIMKPHLLKRTGYYQLTLSLNQVKHTYLVHQLVAMAFLSYNREGFDKVVDHINNDRSDNRILNLRVISQNENVYRSNKPISGLTGAYPRGDKFYSRIVVNGKEYYLGSFDTPEEASESYFNKLKELKS